VRGRFLIVNADDFGQSSGVNRGIVQAFERGILTSASLMVRQPMAAQAADYARTHPDLGVGLHLDLGEWRWRHGKWVAVYEVIDLSDEKAIADQLIRQLDSFFRLVGRLPTHIDSHQHRHLQEPVATIVRETARLFGLPVRKMTIPFCGTFYGQDGMGNSQPDWIRVPALIEILSSLDTEVTEMSCHPAAAKDLDTMYAAERLVELATLCDPRVREAVDKLAITLISFAQTPDAK
jgi:chitin disaccharide deacetylase